MSVKILEAGEKAASVATPTPSETIIRAAPARKIAEITLPSGRVFCVRRLGPLDRMLASKAIGSDLVSNALYANYALVACSVTSIDRSPVSMPSSQAQIEALVFRIGEDWEDLTEEMNRAFKPAEADAFDPDAVKN
ncbi:hypothetical protein MKK55_19055 [Methylobacterium sp. J-059]|uniref:hypothetical protein n=1 Tax=Methylobacterium sp. J-059 TaxID=2836643 RepID=UPI001FBB0ABF|nr:hypothetical protein [Methylobacterium sp. J-059]MCJ2041031.1 hypothetical protein [Methylobacterium sp. J-059]